MRLLFIACVCAFTCAATVTWAAKPEVSLTLVQINRRAADAQKQKSKQEREQKAEEDRKKTTLEHDLENYEKHQDCIRLMLEKAADARTQNQPWDQRMVQFSKLLKLLSKTGYFKPTPMSFLEALAVNLANAYSGNSADGIAEMAAAGYRNLPAATTAALRDLTEDSLALASTVARKAHVSPKKQLKLLRAFSAKFSDHAKMALPEVQGPAAAVIEDHARITSLLNEHEQQELREQAEARRKDLQAKAPVEIQGLLTHARKSVESHQDTALRIATILTNLPQELDEVAAEAYLSELAKCLGRADGPQEIEAINLTAQAIALKTNYNEKGIARRTHILGASLYFALAVVMGYVGVLTGGAQHPGVGAALTVTAAASAILSLLNLMLFDSNATVSVPILEPFGKSSIEKANRKQAEKMMSYFQSQCETLLEEPSNIRVAEQQEEPRVAPAEVHDEEFQEEPEPLKRRNL